MSHALRGGENADCHGTCPAILGAEPGPGQGEGHSTGQSNQLARGVAPRVNPASLDPPPNHAVTVKNFWITDATSHNRSPKIVTLVGLPHSARWMPDGAGEYSFGVGLQLLTNLFLFLVDDRLTDSKLK